MKTTLHTMVPWWAKIGAKMALSRLPVPIKVWHRLGLFVPGFMRDPAYAIDVFDSHWRRGGSPGPGFTYLEIGPGESLATAIVAWAYGAQGGALVDAGDFAVRTIEAYAPLFDRLAQRPGVRDANDLRKLASFDALLAAVNVEVRTDGLHGLRSLPSNSFDLVFSQAVLEHVPLTEFNATVREFYRLQCATGIGSHRVDFKDHLQGSLHNLRFSEPTWEKPWFAQRSGFYTNRLRFSAMKTAFEQAGFSVAVPEQNQWNAPPVARSAMDKSFRDLPDGDLRTSGAVFVVKKASA